MTIKKSTAKLLLERKGSFVSKIQGQSPYVLKVRFGSGPELQNQIEREKIALDVLKGLAVPKRISITKKEAKKWAGDEKFVHLAMEWVPWEGCFAKAFRPDQALALWAFTVEQLCAFRRRKVLYTDFKHNHLRVSSDLTQAVIVDFDNCIMVEPDGQYPTFCIGFTPELSAPEFFFRTSHSEQVIVYGIGMFLGSLLLKYFHNFDITEISLKKIKTKLRDSHLYSLFLNCISMDVSERPKDLEQLLSQIKAQDLPENTYEIWNSLRKPYEKALRKLEFETPKPNRVTRKAG